MFGGKSISVERNCLLINMKRNDMLDLCLYKYFLND